MPIGEQSSNTVVDTPVICLMGPTATGKTDAAALLSEKIRAEIVSVDSSLVYTGMNIGTAKPEPEFLQQYPHHLVNIRHPNDTFSVAEFYNEVSVLIEDIIARGNVPILAGGTMFYFNALESGLTELPKADPKLRQELTEQSEHQGWPALHARLVELDAGAASRIDPHDAQRIQRALEIVMLTGQTVEQLNLNKKQALKRPLLKIALCFSDRRVLHERIARRFDIMLEQGLEQEVQSLLDDGVDPETAAMKMIGYRQMLDFLNNDLSYDDMRDKGVAATRQLAKRQLTWLRNQSNVVWWPDDALNSKKFTNLLSYLTQIDSLLSYNCN